ncbi:MAG: hypothetical protein V7603_2174 [Micromonosporaceae bacterium]
MTVDAAAVAAAPEWQDGIEVPGPGRIRVAAVDRLGGVTPEMIDWWFGRMDRETYHRFHPVDHRKFAWVRGKEPGRYVGATHLTYHCYGGPPSPVLRTEITFLPPPELPDIAVCAVVHALDEQDRPQPGEVARFVHVARRTGYGTELRSCWWLTVGEDTDRDLVTKGRLRHVHEEFAYLTGFLPALYREEAVS